jgi:trans-aconitate 2-methyltransferase
MTHPKEWNAAAYQRVSDPQFAWGRKVLDRIALRGDEVALDVGCGTGRLTALLAERLPRGRVVALDRSENMVAEARARLAPTFGDRVAFRAGDALAIADEGAFDLIFSTATFHWILDQDRLYQVLGRALRPGGRLVAQCGGLGNLRDLRERSERLLRSAAYAGYFEGWEHPWYYAAPDATAARLRASGFGEIEVWLSDAPTPFAGRDAFAEFLRAVVLRVHVARLPEEGLREAFVAEIVEQASRDEVPYSLGYVRLNVTATRASPG